MANIGVLCSGGDVSGMNPAIKRFVEYSFEKGLTPYFIYNGYEGLIDNEIKKASYKDVSGIITRGGSKIGSARSLRFKEKKYRAQAKANLDKHKITQLVVLGGDGSFRGMDTFYQEHKIAFCGIPSTIDNDIFGTEYCLGVDSALNIIKIAIDSIRDTASTFRRAFVVETMGRDCGYLALISALTSGAELCLIPEVDYDLDSFKETFQKQINGGRSYFIIIASEGIKESSKSVAAWFEAELNIETRVTTLGHMQRGGNPTTRDRFMAYQFTTYAIDALLNDNHHSVICYNHSTFSYKSINEVTSNQHYLDQRLLTLASKLLKN